MRDYLPKPDKIVTNVKSRRGKHSVAMIAIKQIRSIHCPDHMSSMNRRSVVRSASLASCCFNPILGTQCVYICLCVSITPHKLLSQFLLMLAVPKPGYYLTSLYTFSRLAEPTQTAAVCDADKYSPGYKRLTSCIPCPKGLVTLGKTPADHDALNDCSKLSS